MSGFEEKGGGPVLCDTDPPPYAPTSRRFRTFRFPALPSTGRDTMSVWATEAGTAVRIQHNHTYREFLPRSLVSSVSTKADEIPAFVTDCTVYEDSRKQAKIKRRISSSMPPRSRPLAPFRRSPRSSYSPRTEASQRQSRLRPCKHL